MRKILIVILFFFVFFKVEAEGNFFSIAPVFGFGGGGWNSEFSEFQCIGGLRGNYWHRFESGFAVGAATDFKFTATEVSFQVNQVNYKLQPLSFSLDEHLSFGYFFNNLFVFFDPFVFSRKMYTTAELKIEDKYGDLGTGQKVKLKSVNSIGVGGSYGGFNKRNVFMMGEAKLFLFDDRYGHLERYIDFEVTFIWGLYLER